MAPKKGPRLEELVREYFARQGFFALRGVELRFDGESITDVDVWLYGRPSASVRTRAVIDCKEKRSPKVFERIFWTRGMQLALGCDRAIVATTSNNPKAIQFAKESNVSLLNKDFLNRLQGKVDPSRRMSSEEFDALIKQYPDQKSDGDWVGKLSGIKSSVASVHGYAAFNRAMTAFRFFGERVETRPKHKEQALRCAYFAAAVACVALDNALERVLYEDLNHRYSAIQNGVTYGDKGDSKVQSNINSILDVISSGMDNGRVISQQVRQSLDNLFSNVRADIIAEYFSREQHAASLFAIGRELEDKAHSKTSRDLSDISPEAKAAIGVFADFVQVKRSALMKGIAADADSGSGDKAPENKGSDTEEQKKLL